MRLFGFDPFNRRTRWLCRIIGHRWEDRSDALKVYDLYHFNLFDTKNLKVRYCPRCHWHNLKSDPNHRLLGAGAMPPPLKERGFARVLARLRQLSGL